jgi:radical SAM protein (TIGR01212 family)
MRYLAYFQSYTSTHGNIDTLIDMYNEAADVPDVVGIIIGTRPDCMPDALLARLAELNRRLPVIIEYGAESSHDTSLRRVNRCHTWQTTVDAVTRTHAAGLRVGLHFILGLPGETTQMMMQTIDRINLLPVDTVKFHQLQIVRHTPLAADFLAGRIPDLHLFQVDEYIDLCAAIINRLRPDIAIERFVSQSPDSLLIAPRWGLKNYQFTNLLRSRLTHR